MVLEFIYQYFNGIFTVTLVCYALKTMYLLCPAPMPPYTASLNVPDGEVGDVMFAEDVVLEREESADQRLSQMLEVRSVATCST